MKIGVISHYRKMEANFMHLAEQEDCCLLFNVGVMDYAVEAAIHMEEALKVDAIISPSVTGAIIQKHINIPVIPLHVRNYSFVEAFYQARQMGERIAFADISHDLSSADFEHIRTMLKIDIKRYIFDNLDEVPSVVERAKSDGCTVLVSTASCMYRQGRKNNMDLVLIEPAEQDMVAAIGIARTFTKLKIKELEKNKWLNAVMDSSSEGIITVDAAGVVTLANTVARNALHVRASELVGRNIAELRKTKPLLDDIFACEERYAVTSVGKKQIVASRENIVTGQDYLGCVIRTSKLDDIRQMEMDARKKARENGLIARFAFDDIISGGQVMAKTKQKARRYARTGSNVLIYGQSGCGKEMFAQSIHNESDFKAGPFVAINCATLPDHLLESELFGYEAGAFTGAKKGGSTGLFEVAHGGTIFLDEIGDMPLQLQAKLLRVLQEKVVRRIGGNRVIPIRVRIIAATNKDLRQRIREETFREDLYYRLNVLSFEIPPLRDRKEDIPELIRHFEESICPGERGRRRILSGYIRQLQAYDWPGNVRELRNFVERVVALSNGDDSDDSMLQAEIDDLPYAAADPPVAGRDGQLVLPLGSMRDMEAEIFRALYRKYDGNKKMIEQVLGLSASTIWRKLKENDIEV